jgi:hypothetical protein
MVPPLSPEKGGRAFCKESNLHRGRVLQPTSLAAFGCGAGLGVLPCFIVRGEAINGCPHFYLEQFHGGNFRGIGRLAFCLCHSKAFGFSEATIFNCAAKFAGEVGGFTDAVAVSFDELMLSHGELHCAEVCTLRQKMCLVFTKRNFFVSEIRFHRQRRNEHFGKIHETVLALRAISL